MNDEAPGAGEGEGFPPGLCGACRHARLVQSDRGSVFVLCRRSRTDSRFPRYPRLPVRACPGFEVRAEDPEEDAG